MVGVHHSIKNESYTWKNALQGAFFLSVKHFIQQFNGRIFEDCSGSTLKYVIMSKTNFILHIQGQAGKSMTSLQAKLATLALRRAAKMQRINREFDEAKGTGD